MRVPFQRIHTCAYCPNKIYIIDSRVYPNDVLAERHVKGWKSGSCIEADIQKMIVESKKIKEEENKKEDLLFRCIVT
jgi:hypothetical protein